MPKARVAGLPQHDASQAHYGAFDIEMFPDGTAPLQIPVWSGVQWYLLTLTARAGVEIDMDLDAGTLDFVNSDYRVADTLTADAIFLKAASATFTGNAILLKTATPTFTADAVLV